MPLTETEHNERAKASLDTFTIRQIGRVRARLHDTQDRLARLTADDLYRDGQPLHAQVAAQVVHEIQMMISNMPLDTLITAARDAEQHALTMLEQNR